MAKSNRDLNKHICSDKVKWLVTAVTFLLLAVFLAAACTQGFTNANPWGWFGKEDEAAEDGGAEITPDGTLSEQDDVPEMQVLAAKIAREDFAKEGIMSIADSAIKLTATISPTGAEDAKLDWSIAFKDASSGWASGKSIGDYLTVTPTADGALTANVTCKQAFGAQAIVTASIRGNASVKATATVDYRQKYSSVTANIAYTNTATAANVTWALGSSSAVTVNFPGYAKSLTELTNYYGASGSNKGTYTVTITTALSSVYTLAATLGATKIEVAPTAEYRTAVTGAGGTISTAAGTYVSVGTGTGAASSAITGFDFTKVLMVSGSSMDYLGFKKALRAKSPATKMFDIKITTTVNGQAQTKVYAITFAADSFGTFASGVQFDKSGIEF